MARTALRAVKTMGLSSIPSLTEKEANSSTFLKGAVLVDSSGTLAEGGSNPTNIVGVADRPGQNGTSKNTRYVPALRNIIFEISFDKASALGTVSPAQTDLNVEYGITKDSAGVWYLDIDKTTTNGRVRIIGFKDAIGTIQGRVYVYFTGDSTIYDQS